MKKKYLLLGIIVLATLTNCKQNSSDILAVKKSKSDLGAMYDKTVEEVIQDVAGLNGKANWSTFKPDGDFSEDAIVVEVNITKKDTIVYKSVEIQFMYNRSTGYIQQGAISVNGTEISLSQWWDYYMNILVLNSGAFENEQSKSNAQNTEVSENSILNQSNDIINLTPFKLSAIPDSLYGCSCLYSDSKSNYESDNYLYFNDMGANCMISINKKIIFLSQVEEDIYENDYYKVLIEEIQILSTEGEGSEISATLVVIDLKNGDEITKKIYGICGC